VVAIAPFAPHIAEELHALLGYKGSICDAEWPKYNEEYLKESNVTYSISFNGKMRYTLDLPVDMDNKTIEETVLSNEQSQKWIEGKTIRKIIIVPRKIVNVVVG
jgi:leucyl-tRNA synthetase